MYRRQLYSLIVAMVLMGSGVAGSGCGGLATPAPDSDSARGGESVVETASQALDSDREHQVRRQLPARLQAMADEIELVPVETDSTGSGIYDVVLRMTAADDRTSNDSASTESDGDAKASDGDATDGDPIPLPADPAPRLSGKDHDGDPIPLPADRTSNAGGDASDGDPIPLPAIRLGGFQADDEESGGSTTTYTYRTEEMVTVVIANVEL